MGVHTPTGEDAGQAAHITLGIGLNGSAVHELKRAIVAQIQEPNGEELHELTGVIFIGLRARHRVGFDIALVGQIVSHRRGHGDLFNQGAKVAKHIGLEDVQVVCNAELAPTRIDSQHRDHPNFAEGLNYFLSQHIRRTDEFFPHHIARRHELRLH